MIKEDEIEKEAQEERGKNIIDNLIYYCNDWAGNVGRYWHTDKPFELASESMYPPEQVIPDFFKEMETSLFTLAAVIKLTNDKVGLNTVNELLEKVKRNK